MNSTITTGIASLAFSLILPATVLAATAPPLGTTVNFAVLGGSTITNTGSTIVNGDLGLNPGTSVTGFPPGTVNGTQHINNAVSAQAQSDLVTAYNSASAQSGAVTVSGDLGGQTLTPNVYNSASSLGITGTLTLDGQNDPDSVFIFQIGSALTTASASSVNLTNGAQACNVFWQVGSSATLGTNSSFVGNVLALSSITVTTGASVIGRVLARNGAVTLDTSPITKTSCALAVATEITTATPTTPTTTQTQAIAVATSTPTPSIIVVSPTVASTSPVSVTTVASTSPVSVTTAPITPVVSIPSFPEAGFPPREESSNGKWNTVLLFGVLILTPIVIVIKKLIT